VSNPLGQGRALPTELFSQYVFVDNQKTPFHLFPCQGRNASNLLGQGRVLYQLSYFRNNYICIGIA